ncbi:RNA demethylase ALKBH10B isoform X2 [Raphanus sativus]|uniref:RNA demethylase ALKBH10B isoform X2 n=1 Tax=Raphanus sativus TaxID=3726 RepID=A0A6J0JF69_RAPSA|nr:RNA demethylase ALKBH10B isoform X2 [Raphanus sativus]
MAIMPPGNWIPDGRDGFISWIRGEFAAANAIIDSLCQHLVVVGDQNEYESVISTIQQRQASWSQVLYMQQFYSIADISYSLHQAAALKRRQQQQGRHYSSDQFGGVRRSGSGFNKHHHGGGGGYRGEGAESMVRNNRENGNEKPKSGLKDLEESESAEAETVNHDCNSAFKDNKQDKKDKECCASMARTFVVEEMYEAKLVNVVEGLKLYEKMVDVNEVSQLVSLANNLRNAGRRGQLQSEAYVSYKRPNRGHGREVIQLGLPIADTMPDDDESIKDRRIEPIPSFLSDIIERFVSKQIIPVKPDACIIDFFNEGDHSQPHMFASWFGRPVGILSLSECDFTFGRVIVSDHPGDYKGSLKLSLTPGSLLLVEDKSADLAKFAIHSIPKQRILITFTKSQPRNSNWSPPPSRSPHNHHHSRHKRPVQTIFKAPSPPLAAPMPPFQGGVIPVGTSWPLPTQPRVPFPGTGVFLPPGSAQEHAVQGNSGEGKLEMKTREVACTAAKEGDGNNGKQIN